MASLKKTNGEATSPPAAPKTVERRNRNKKSPNPPAPHILIIRNPEGMPLITMQSAVFIEDTKAGPIENSKNSLDPAN